MILTEIYALLYEDKSKVLYYEVREPVYPGNFVTLGVTSQYKCSNSYAVMTIYIAFLNCYEQVIFVVNSVLPYISTTPLWALYVFHWWTFAQEYCMPCNVVPALTKLLDASVCFLAF